jgi:hypothetical protein
VFDAFMLLHIFIVLMSALVFCFAYRKSFEV